MQKNLILLFFVCLSANVNALSITDLKTGKDSHITGLTATVVGDLFGFKHNNLVKKDN